MERSYALKMDAAGTNVSEESAVGSFEMVMSFLPDYMESCPRRLIFIFTSV
jgi:hypothetical protein